MLALGARYHAEGARGKRKVEAAKFYKGAYDTALKEGEILTAVSIPVPPAGHGYTYEKLKRKVGDYATAAAAVVLTMRAGKVASCSIGLTNLGDTPLLASKAASLVVGSDLDDATLKKAADAARAIMSPAADEEAAASNTANTSVASWWRGRSSAPPPGPAEGESGGCARPTSR